MDAWVESFYYRMRKAQMADALTAPIRQIPSAYRDVIARAIMLDIIARCPEGTPMSEAIKHANYMESEILVMCHNWTLHSTRTSLHNDGFSLNILHNVAMSQALGGPTSPSVLTSTRSPLSEDDLV